MGRINGANSDYKHNGSGVVEQQSSPLYLKLYICPDGLKSPLETNDPLIQCKGTKNDCPSNKIGHALIHLNEEDGVEIMAGDNNRILVKQNGEIELGKEGGPARIILQNDGQILIYAGTVTINGNLAVTGSYPGQ
jgi:hypothetical protein